MYFFVNFIEGVGDRNGEFFLTIERRSNMLKRALLATLVIAMAFGCLGLVPEMATAAGEKITVANFGALRFDPAVMITNARFFRKYRIEVDVIEVPDTKIYEEISKSLALG